MRQNPLTPHRRQALEAAFAAVQKGAAHRTFDDGGLRIAPKPGALRITVLQQRLDALVWGWCETKGVPKRVAANLIELPVG
ncbi:MAG TPA: hypothetical protein VFZ48_03420 [Candidatus Saccharimonadales bacterium]